MSLFDSLLGAAPWPWLGAGAIAGAAAALAWPRRDRRPLAPLWQSIGRPQAGAGDASWQQALAAVARQRDAAQQSQLLQLRTVAAEQRLALCEAVLTHLQDGLLVLDRTERILFANETARRLLGMGDATDVTLGDSGASGEVLDGVRSVLAADLARGVKSVRIECQSGDARAVHLIRAIAELPLGGAQHAQIVVLEDWTAEERQARAKSEFIYSVSHELKTPLTAIQASLELANEPAGLEPADRDKLIQVSYEESVRLSQMVVELLDLARIEAGITEFKREPVDLRTLFQNLHAMHEPLAEKKQITLRWDISDYLPDFVGDPRLLRQALVNVVGNAIKYTKAGGEVGLTARLEGPELVTRVRDTGIGIAPEDQARVFEKFFRAKSAEQSSIQGTGLGLPMARYIVEHHRGRIEFTSELGVGTEFRIYLPALSAEPDEQAGPSLVAVDGATR
jgi:signal transduction histidine kinase